MILTPHKRHQFPDRLLSAQEAADLLGISKRAVERLTQRGKLPFVRPGGGRFLKYRLYTLMDVMARDERRLA